MLSAILDAFSGIAGDMMLGALIDVGLEAEWLRSLPGRLALDGVTVRIERVKRGDISCAKVDFDIPPQPHGRHIRDIRKLVDAAGVPESVRDLSNRAFTAIAASEGEIHGVQAERVHLHEVGAVDAILDVVGSIWGLEQLGVNRVYCGAIALGDGTVRAAHGMLPVPAPATLKLLEGHVVRPGPEGAGELVTPTGAALVRVLSAGPPPDQYVPLRSGFGAGTKDFKGRANALRIIIADSHAIDGTARTEEVVQLAADIDDMDPEALAAAANSLRAAGALDVVVIPVVMKKGRLGSRVEVLTKPSDYKRIQDLVFLITTTIGVRRATLQRSVLVREVLKVAVLEQEIRVKVVTLPNGGARAKPEFDDVNRVALASGRSVQSVSRQARETAERMLMAGVSRANPQTT
ncbi:MAG: nickel pincer cofactor biosynthesis protein LarC [Anaerolineae bacterium]|nr:nickel pincer cofactor biosynthesis protein LarC [Gemmatimonadaceae bacterium]